MAVCSTQLVSNSSITGWQQEEEIQGLDTVRGHDDAGGRGEAERGEAGRGAAWYQ